MILLKIREPEYNDKIIKTFFVYQYLKINREN